MKLDKYSRNKDNQSINEIILYISCLNKPRDKNQVVFPFGDYEFLCKVFGIAGASGK